MRQFVAHDGRRVVCNELPRVASCVVVSVGLQFDFGIFHFDFVIFRLISVSSHTPFFRFFVNLILIKF